MPLDKNQLGWIPDYPDFRDMKVTNIDMNKNIIKEQSQNQEDTSSQIIKLLDKLIDQMNDENINNYQGLKEEIDKLKIKNENEIKFLNVKVENKVLLYRGITQNKIIEIQDLLEGIFCDLKKGDLKKGDLKNLEDLKFERGYFGEATNHFLILFKKMWELPSQNSIVDFNHNYDDKIKQKEEEEDFYEYNPESSIYTVLKTIHNRITINNKNENKDAHKKIGDYGDEVIKIKEKLQTMGYFDFSLSPEAHNYQYSKCFFGCRTDLVVKFFQGINGLNPDGRVGEKTWKKFDEKRKNDEPITQNTKNIEEKLSSNSNSMTYIQGKLYTYFGKKNLKINGKLDPETKNSINTTIGKDKDSTITMDSLKKLLQKIVDQAEESKKYSLYQTLIFPEHNPSSKKNKKPEDSPRKTFLSIQQPIPQNIITIFQANLKLNLFLQKESSDSNKIFPVIYPLIQLLIKNFSDIGIHGQLDYEQAITQAIDLINIFLVYYPDAKEENGKIPDTQKQLFNNDENMTKFLFEFVRGRRDRDREINLMLIFQSLSAEERKRLIFLLWISLDKIESIIDEIEDYELYNKNSIKKLKSCFKEQENSDKNLFNSSIKNKDDKNNQTILQIHSVRDPKLSSNSDQTLNQYNLSVPFMSKLENHINLYDPSETPVYLCLPEFVDLSYWCPPIKNQKPLNSCTACAAIDLVEYFQNRTHDEYTNASVLFLYKVARKLMHREGDVGASIRETMKAMVLFGIPPKEYWPYEPSKIDEEPSGFCYSYAQNYQTIQYFRLDTPGLRVSDLLAQIKMTLVAGLPSMFGLTIYSSIYEDVNYKRGYIPIPKPKDNVEGGHAVVAVGYDDSKTIGDSVGALLIRNSWGTNWGEQGYGWLPYDYILKGLTSDWWSLIKAEWFETKNFGLGANDWKNNDNRGGDEKKGNSSSTTTPPPKPPG